MTNQDIILSAPDQLDAMSQAHQAHADAAQTVGHQLASGQGTLQGLTNWSGAGFEDMSQFLSLFTAHMSAFSAVKSALARSVATSKANYGSTESANARSLTDK
jgi:uncharacterized protein YukE